MPNKELIIKISGEIWTQLIFFDQNKKNIIKYSSKIIEIYWNLIVCNNLYKRIFQDSIVSINIRRNIHIERQHRHDKTDRN
jgi:hypothetical protein